MENAHLKKILFTTAICVIFIGSSIPNDEINDLEKYRLKGNVKSVMEIKYSKSDNGDNAVKSKILFQKYTIFDIKGYETETTLFKNGGEFLSSKYIFGTADKQVEMNEYNSDGTLNLNVKYIFDDKGVRSEAIYNWAEDYKIGDIVENTDYYYEVILNDLFAKVLYKYDYRGYCLEENYLKVDGSLSFKFVSKYDFRGNKLEMGYFHGNGRLSWMTKFKYDRYDNLIESRVYKSNRIAVLSEYKYQFDDIGNWVTCNEKRNVYVNILTAGLDRANTVTERIIEYY